MVSRDEKLAAGTPPGLFSDVKFVCLAAQLERDHAPKGGKLVITMAGSS